MRTIGPSQIAASEPISPTAKNGGSFSRWRTCHALTVISGPIPAGSPSDMTNDFVSIIGFTDLQLYWINASSRRSRRYRLARFSTFSLSSCRSTSSTLGAARSDGSSRPHRTSTLIPSPCDPNGCVARPTASDNSVFCNCGGMSRIETSSRLTTDAPSCAATASTLPQPLSC